MLNDKLKNVCTQLNLYKDADFAEENDNEHDYEDNYIINSEFKTLEIKLDRLGNHQLSYYVVEENKIIKSQKLFG